MLHPLQTPPLPELQQNLSQPDSYPLSSSNELTPNSPTNSLQSRLPIFHPAPAPHPISTVPPSSTALTSDIPPTIFALASTIPHPTIDQICPKRQNSSSIEEETPIPFNTIHRSSGSIDSTGSFSAELSIPKIDTNSSNSSTNKMTTTNVTNGHERAANQTPPLAVAKEKSNGQSQLIGNDETHPYFSACNLLENPELAYTKNKNNSSPLIASSTSLLANNTATAATTAATSAAESAAVAAAVAAAAAALDENSSSVSGQDPQLQATSFFTPSSNSTLLPEQAIVKNSHLSPNQFHSVGKDIPLTAQVADPHDTNVSVFGFAPQLSSHVTCSSDVDTSQSFVIGEVSDRVDPKRPTICRVDGSDHCAQEQGGDDNDELSRSGLLMDLSHARAGISAALKLKPLEGSSEAEPCQGTEIGMNAYFESKDWSTTSLGPRSKWPVELEMMVKYMLRSAAPIALYWGEDSNVLYND
ncbi:hypothetical protein BGZ76_005667, partial [Entomortierella beljakovae]